VNIAAGSSTTTEIFPYIARSAVKNWRVKMEMVKLEVSMEYTTDHLVYDDVGDIVEIPGTELENIGLVDVVEEVLGRAYIEKIVAYRRKSDNTLWATEEQLEAHFS
jgi:hypothetical protein